jgi:hypothetical protein
MQQTERQGGPGVNTPAHLIFALAAFGRADRPRVTAAALAGGLIPDLSLYLMAGTHLFLLGTPAQTVFGQLYFSDAWQSVFRIDNSILLWGVALAFALWARSATAIALTGSALLHLAFDFPLHHDDGRAHFWPLTDWIFQSPVSYWDNRHYGGIVGPVEIAVCLVLTVILWRRFPGWPMRALIAALALAEAAPGMVWMLVF